MASEKILQTKQAQVDELTAKIKESVAGVVVDYRGITVENDTKLRRELREAGVEYTVYKNNILRRAAKAAGYEGVQEFAVGTTAFALSKEDPIAPAKILAKYTDAANGALELKGGYMDGKVLDKAGVVAVSKLPGKQELLTMLCMALNGNIRGLAVALNAVKEKKEGEAA